MKLNLVDDIDDLKEKGDALIVIGRNKKKQLILCCPGCGRKSGSRGGHVFDESTKTYKPSIVHNTEYGGCGWHGWLTNGEFKNV